MPRGVGGVRDPRSVEWDGATRSVLISAIRAMRQRKGVIVWVASPASQFGHKDGGGRTAEERAFTRSAYYHVFGLPHKLGIPQEYSLKLTWGNALQPSSHGRRARACRVRLYDRASGVRTSSTGRQSWVAEIQATGDSSFQRSKETLNARQTPRAPTVRS
jgi:hypothetical protein